MPQRGQASHPANAATKPQAANASGMRQQAATPHPQGAAPNGGQGQAAKSREAGEPKGEGQRH